MTKKEENLNTSEKHIQILNKGDVPETNFGNTTSLIDEKSKKPLRYCSFCSRHEHEVICLVGTNEKPGAPAYICDGCAQMCADIVLQKLWDNATRLQKTIRGMEEHGGIPAIAGVSEQEIPQPNATEGTVK